MGGWGVGGGVGEGGKRRRGLVKKRKNIIKINKKTLNKKKKTYLLDRQR